MSLYGKLKNIRITDEQLAFIRYQAKKMLANPMLRGDSVLALIMATFTFEVLCGVQVSSTVLHGNVYQFADACKKYEEDEILGYQCALVSLGLLFVCFCFLNIQCRNSVCCQNSEFRGNKVLSK